MALRKLTDDLAPLVAGTQQLHQMAYAQIRPQVDWLCAQTVSEDAVAHCLDDLLSFAGDDEILRLYKKVCRRYLNEYPDTIKYYIRAYFEMWEEEQGPVDPSVDVT